MNNFSSVIIEVRGNGTIFLMSWKKKYNQPRTLYPTKIYFKNEGEIKILLDEGKWREFAVTWKIIKEVI